VCGGKAEESSLTAAMSSLSLAKACRYINKGKKGKGRQFV